MEQRISERICRVVKFIVPSQAREEFINEVRNVNEVLRTLPGFLQDFVLEQVTEPGEFNFVTVVEWDSSDSLENAKAAAIPKYKEMNINPQETFARLGVKADLADYRRIDV